MSRLTTVQEFALAVRWEGIRAHWLTRQNRFKEAEEAKVLAHEMKEQLVRLQGGRG